MITIRKTQLTVNGRPNRVTERKKMMHEDEMRGVRCGSGAEPTFDYINMVNPDIDIDGGGVGINRYRAEI